jgi:NAD(P) transhydrogenase subunit alpha
MIVGVPKETYPGERRVALIPGALASLGRATLDVVVEAGAGSAAGISDAEYRELGANVGSRDELFARADVVVQVRTFGANPQAGAADLPRMRPGQAFVGFMDPLGSPHHAVALAARGVITFAIELMPRISRAQSMDALSSMAALAGYRAVIIAAESLPRIFPLMMTAAGTVSPAKVFVIGVGVAGLQAIATARRLGAVVEAYDVRPEVKEQVQSVGGKFVELQLDTAGAGGAGGYARAQSEEFYCRQRDLMTAHVRAADVVVTTAAVPGRRAPRLVSAGMVEGMRPGSVIVDLAAEAGGNCELTEAGRTVIKHGVMLHGPVNVPSALAPHASQLYSRNVSAFLLHLVKAGTLTLDRTDEITRGTLVTHGGQVVHEMVVKALTDVKAA